MAWDLHLPATGSAAPVVVIAHGFKGFKDWGFFPELASTLAAAGFASLRFNMSHNGVGLGPDAGDFTRLDLFAKNRPSFELHDLRAVLTAVRDGRLADGAALDRSRIGLLGHSRGGAAVLLAGADEGVRAVVTWAAVASMRLPDEACAAFESDGHWSVLNARTGQMMRLDRTAYDDVTPMPEELDLDRCVPLLGAELMLLHGAADTSVPPGCARTLHELTSGRARLELVAGADHVMGCRHPFAGRTAAFDEACRLTIDHLGHHLLAG